VGAFCSGFHFAKCLARKMFQNALAPIVQSTHGVNILHRKMQHNLSKEACFLFIKNKKPLIAKIFIFFYFVTFLIKKWL
jgi:hypothetical protein